MTPALSVFDSVIFLQSLANPEGSAAACWHRVKSGELIHFVSKATLSELADVISRPKLMKKLSFDEASAMALLESVRAFSLHLEPIANAFRYLRDPDDEPIINLAIEAEAQFLVTWDNDLLDLMEPENADGQTLKAQAPNLRIVTPPEMLRTLRAGQPPE